METPNINWTCREALLQQCLADLDMNIRDLDAEPKERDLLVTTWAKTHEIEENAGMLSGAGVGIEHSAKDTRKEDPAEEEKEMMDKCITAALGTSTNNQTTGEWHEEERFQSQTVRNKVRENRQKSGQDVHNQLKSCQRVGTWESKSQENQEHL
jgi:hypothetical protein